MVLSILHTCLSVDYSWNLHPSLLCCDTAITVSFPLCSIPFCPLAGGKNVEITFHFLTGCGAGRHTNQHWGLHSDRSHGYHAKPSCSENQWETKTYCDWFWENLSRNINENCLWYWLHLQVITGGEPDLDHVWADMFQKASSFFFFHCFALGVRHAAASRKTIQGRQPKEMKAIQLWSFKVSWLFWPSWL